MAEMTLYIEEIDPDDDTPVEVPDGDWEPSGDGNGTAVDLGDLTDCISNLDQLAAEPGAAEKCPVVGVVHNRDKCLGQLVVGKLPGRHGPFCPCR